MRSSGSFVGDARGLLVSYAGPRNAESFEVTCVAEDVR